MAEPLQQLAAVQKESQSLNMRKILVILAVVLSGLQALAQDIKAGPWVCNVRENTITVLWTSEKPGMAWVELQDGSRHYETYAGRRVFGRLHSIRLEGFAPGQLVRYRIGGQVLVSDAKPRKPVFGEEYSGGWHSIRTFDSARKECRFSVFNDIHMRLGDYRALAAQVVPAETDFIFLNGDIVSAGNYELDTLVRYSIEPLGGLTASLPLLFARGNHEGRGNNLKLVADVYPNTSPAPFYYTFREGPVAFVVLDGGETGTERSVLFCGSEVYEDYLHEQMDWARKTLFEPEFSEAPVKVCLVHVPMIDHPQKGDYHLQRWMNREMLPILNEAGIDLMIGADLHVLMYCEPGSMGNDFPIVVNDDARRLDCRYSDGTFSVRMYAPSGKLEFSKDVRVR